MFTPSQSASDIMHAQVVDNVLKDPEASDQVLYNRAKVNSHQHDFVGL